MLTMQESISCQQHIICFAKAATKKKKYSLNQFFILDDVSDKDDVNNSILDRRRETFYSPPRNKETKTPTFFVLFGAPIGGFVWRLWRSMGGNKNNKWHNKIANETYSEE